VIAALGIIYGTLLGGLLGSLGLITGGLLGYVLMLTSARYMQRFVGPQPLHKMESLFDRGGAWAIVLTRSLPYSVPEAMVFLAGLAGMPMGKFIAALTIGSVPTAFVFAAIGAGWANQPILALVMRLRAPHPLATHRALSHAAGSTVGDVNTGHRFPYRLPARLCGTHIVMVSERASQLLRRLGAALRRQRSGNDRLVHIHVGDGRDADARRLDDVDGVDAGVRTNVARRRGVVPPTVPTSVVELLVGAGRGSNLKVPGGVRSQMEPIGMSDRQHLIRPLG
jgi:membrane protein YqaA with SNARE-associated domain